MCAADWEGLGRVTVSYAWLGCVSISRFFFNLSGDIRSKVGRQCQVPVHCAMEDFLYVNAAPKVYVVSSSFFTAPTTYTTTSYTDQI